MNMFVLQKLRLKIFVNEILVGEQDLHNFKLNCDNGSIEMH
jgi:hypothetical protein